MLLAVSNGEHAGGAMDHSIVALALDHLFAGAINICQLGSERALRLSGLGFLAPFMPATVLTSTVSGPYLIKSPGEH